MRWASATRIRNAGPESGDVGVVEPFPTGYLVAAIDGLGHGREAAHAAQAAAEVLRAHPGDPVIDLLSRCHERLKGTRGAVMSLAALDARASTLTWTGVGNVEGVLLRPDAPREYLLLRGGLVGMRLPTNRAATIAIKPNDVLVLATDGIQPGFAATTPIHADVQAIADHIVDNFATNNDDALAMVVRWSGGDA